MRAVFAALAANLGIAVVKFIAFLFTGSASLLAEAVHSVADTGNEVLVIVGRGRSRRPRSEEHPFGFGRERYFYRVAVHLQAVLGVQHQIVGRAARQEDRCIRAVNRADGIELMLGKHA